jgi:thioester reductase-like protein
MKNPNSRKTILLTGVTGLLGRHVLYEFLRQILSGKLNASLYAVIRRKPDTSSDDRLESIFASPSLPSDLAKHEPADLRSHITVVEADIRSDDLEKRFSEVLPRRTPISVITMAASTNLFSNERSRREVYENNYLGTLNLVRALRGFTKKLTYVSTAYATGIRAGIISNECERGRQLAFRTPYEYYKHTTENELIRIFRETGEELQIVRPSVICGRLIDDLRFFTSKFDVFYGWAKFFYKMKMAGRSNPVRIFINRDSGLNIVPVDYAAKAVLKASRLPVAELNIIHSRCVPHIDYLGSILDLIGYPGCSFVSAMPERLTPIERLYYGTAGSAFTPYITSPAHEFDAQALRYIANDIAEPDIMKGLPGLISFALESGFECADEVPAQAAECV